MSIALDLLCLAVPFTIIFTSVLSIATSIGGCGWPISARDVRMDVAFCHFSSNPTNYASMGDVMMFLMILNSTCTGLFSGRIDLIGVFMLNFGPRKNIHLI